jgi:hypothetical protein
MDEYCNDRIPIRSSTKRLLKEEKDDDTTYDLWIRKQLGAAGNE